MRGTYKALGYRLAEGSAVSAPTWRAGFTRIGGKRRPGFLLKHVTREPALSLETVRDILDWCANFPSNEDALRRVTALGSRHLCRRGVGDRLVEAARAIVDALPPRPDSLTRGQVADLIYFVVASPDVERPTYRENADDVVLAWLRHAASYGRDPRPHRWVQRKRYANGSSTSSSRTAPTTTRSMERVASSSGSANGSPSRGWPLKARPISGASAWRSPRNTRRTARSCSR